MRFLPIALLPLVPGLEALFVGDSDFLQEITDWRVKNATKRKSRNATHWKAKAVTASRVALSATDAVPRDTDGDKHETKAAIAAMYAADLAEDLAFNQSMEEIERKLRQRAARLEKEQAELQKKAHAMTRAQNGTQAGLRQAAELGSSAEAVKDAHSLVASELKKMQDELDEQLATKAEELRHANGEVAKFPAHRSREERARQESASARAMMRLDALMLAKAEAADGIAQASRKLTSKHEELETVAASKEKLESAIAAMLKEVDNRSVVVKANLSNKVKDMEAAKKAVMLLEGEEEKIRDAQEALYNQLPQAAELPAERIMSNVHEYQQKLTESNTIARGSLHDKAILQELKDQAALVGERKQEAVALWAQKMEKKSKAQAIMKAQDTAAQQAKKEASREAHHVEDKIASLKSQLSTREKTLREAKAHLYRLEQLEHTLTTQA